MGSTQNKKKNIFFPEEITKQISFQKPISYVLTTELIMNVFSILCDTFLPQGVLMLKNPLSPLLVSFFLDSPS